MGFDLFFLIVLDEKLIYNCILDEKLIYYFNLL